MKHSGRVIFSFFINITHVFKTISSKKKALILFLLFMSMVLSYSVAVISDEYCN